MYGQESEEVRQRGVNVGRQRKVDFVCYYGSLTISMFI